MKKNIWYNILISATLLLFTACGGGGGTTLSVEQQALNKIANYVNNGTEAPEASDYQTLHIAGVTEENVDAINQLIDDLDITTVTDIQGAVDALEVFRAYAASNGANGHPPSQADYEALGITGVTDANRAAINDLIAGKVPTQVDSQGEIQGIVGGYVPDPDPNTITRYPSVGLDNKQVAYYRQDLLDPDMPVVLFIKGGGSAVIDSYSGIMQFLASEGYYVIGVDADSYRSSYITGFFESALTRAKDTHGLNVSKLAVMGHSLGGGQAFYVMKHFRDAGYGDDASVALSIDGWFAFDMNQTDINGLDSNVAFLQMNGLAGTGTDPRIHLKIWDLATTAASKSFYTLPANEHGYVAGNLESILQKEDLLAIIGGITHDIFTPSHSGVEAIPAGNKASYVEILSVLQAKDTYHSGDCAGIQYNAIDVLQDFDIDYCAVAVYPSTTVLAPRATDATVLKPTLNHPTIDPVYHTSISLVHKSDDEIANYPKVQSWNSNMSLLRIGSRLYNANTLEESNITKGQDAGEAYDTLCSRSSDYFRWSNKTPYRFYVLNSAYQFVQADIHGDTVDCSTVLDAFPEYEVIHMGPHEGNIDNNDTYVVFIAKKPNDTSMYVILYDIQKAARVWAEPKQMPEQSWEWKTVNGSSFWAPSTMDWLAISQSGKYIVYNNNNGNRDGMYRYDINFENKVKLQYRWSGNGELYSEGGHGDLGYDTEGNEVFVQFISGVGVYSFNLDTPSEEGKELLGSPYGGGHISCRNINRPGWCYVTANMDSDGNGLRRVFALKLDGTGDENIQNFSQTHIDDGFAETYGGTNPNGTKMIFNSHWDTNTVETFIVEGE